ncbi:related to translation initiation factor eif3 p40 subunit [Ceraceosorus bombacis]|uniref:Eukaryotic translation initiation factor 3 subunit H n=1 Tax=Ceraceosorus bombacis TaxID=401625 RepID=A0A0P1BM46_9BASI|nr:related to translation initiation factor eif3 p40 subunit [Ceraceosorus bombacis]
MSQRQIPGPQPRDVPRNAPSAKDAHPHQAAGALLGLDIGGALEVSNAFPLPASSLKSSGGDDEDIEKSAKSAARYTASMVKLMRDVNADANPVGLYQSCFLGSFLQTPIVEGLFSVAGLLEREGPHGRGKGVLVVHDLAQSAQGNTVVKAYRLAPSFIEAHRKNAFTASGLIEHRLTFSNILTEIPVSLHNTAMLSSLLSTLSTPAAPTPGSLESSTAYQLAHPPTAAISSPHTLLALTHTPVLSSALESTLEALDDYAAENGNVGYQSRQLAREKARLEAQIARKQAENVTREAQGLTPLPIEEKLKLGNEPSRLESTMLLGQLDDKARRLAEICATTAVQLNASRTGAI